MDRTYFSNYSVSIPNENSLRKEMVRWSLFLGSWYVKQNFSTTHVVMVFIVQKPEGEKTKKQGQGVAPAESKFLQ